MHGKFGSIDNCIFVFILKDGGGFIGGFVDAFYEVFAEGTYPGILLMLALFGALIQLLLESGGINGFRKLALRYIKSEKSSLVFTWILGVILCIDDYINDLAIGPSVRAITDRYGVPLEQIGFVVCSMGVPFLFYPMAIILTAFLLFEQFSA